MAAIEKAGHPVVRIAMPDIYDLGAEFFRWEIATAVAGSIIGINAFNQPDVEASKIATRELTSAYEKTGSLPPEKPVIEDAGIKLFTDEKNAAELAKAAGGDKSLVGYLKAHLARIKAGDYFAVLGYIQMNAEHEQSLQALRHSVRDKKRVATCLGFGPRFLHSTGQAYKGGPNSGVFLQITCDDSVELPVPGQKYTFGVVKAAQARGDFQVLAERGTTGPAGAFGEQSEGGAGDLAGSGSESSLDFLGSRMRGRDALATAGGTPALLGARHMQLGMVGLGRMGANMTRRLMRGGHQLVVSDLSARLRETTGGRGRGWIGFARRSDRQADASARGLDHGSGGRSDRSDGAETRGAPASRRRHHRRRQLVF